MDKTNNADVSIIIPVYNSEKYLAKCLDSVIAQNYKNYEVIVIYDKSDDDGLSVLEHYSKNYGNIKIYHNKKKQGLSYAKNIGIEISTGKYITFVDSDDIVSANYISYLTEILEKNDCDISICNTVSNDEDLDKNTDNTEFVMNNKEGLKEMFYGRKFGVSSWGKMYKKCLFDNIEFPIGLLYEDLLTTHKLIEKSNAIVYTNKNLYCYHPLVAGSLSNTPNNNNIEQLISSSDEILYYAKSHYSDVIHSVEVRYINNLLRCLSLGFNDPVLFSSIKKKIKSCNIKDYLLDKDVTKKNKILLLGLLFNKSVFNFLNNINRKHQRKKYLIVSNNSIIFYPN